MSTQKETGVIVIIFICILSLLGLGFLLYGIIEDVPLSFGLGILIVWTTIVPRFVGLFKTKK
jgi:hypothetical protein